MAIKETMYMCCVCGKRSKKEETITKCEEAHSKEKAKYESMRKVEKELIQKYNDEYTLYWDRVKSRQKGSEELRILSEKIDEAHEVVYAAQTRLDKLREEYEQKNVEIEAEEAAPVFPELKLIV